jgi:hypothetical protein
MRLYDWKVKKLHTKIKLTASRKPDLTEWQADDDSKETV